jgi:hypothetical protein
MRLFHRRDAPPSDVVARLPRDERVVSWADVSGGRVVLATPSGLWWPGPADEAPRRIGWQYITKAVWQARTLTVTQADVVDDLLLVDRAPVALELEVPRDLPPVVRKRVETNVVRSELIEIAGGVARFVARRVPGEDGVRWWARLEGGTPDTDQVRSAVSARMALLRAEHEARSSR